MPTDDPTTYSPDMTALVRADMHRRATPQQLDYLRSHTAAWHAELTRMDADVTASIDRYDARQREGHVPDAGEADWRLRAEGFRHHVRTKLAEVEALREDRARVLETAARRAVELLDDPTVTDPCGAAMSVLERALEVPA